MIKRYLKRAFKHKKEYYKNLFFHRVNEKELANRLSSLGIDKGKIVYIQSAFGSLGYYPGGANKFIYLIRDIVGPKGTIVMPCFPTGGAMEDYVIHRPIFNVNKTPSNIGVLPETMRSTPGVKRSCHPTHSVVALGYHADEIINGHEYCLSPQGDGSPFDKLIKLEAIVLRLGAPAYPLCHRLQEIIGWPNLFLPESICLDCINIKGQRIKVSTRVYRKRIPFVFFLSQFEDGTLNPINIIDFPILFSSREFLYSTNQDKIKLYPLMINFRRLLEKTGSLKVEKYNGCYMDAFRADISMEFAVKKAKELISQYRDAYELNLLVGQMEKGLINLY